MWCAYIFETIPYNLLRAQSAVSKTSTYRGRVPYYSLSFQVLERTLLAFSCATVEMCAKA